MGRPTRKPADPPPAAPADDLRPLVELCRGGRLFAVQEWVAAGRPVCPPAGWVRRGNARTPLEAAVETGFHSLVEVLLRSGATAHAGWWDGPLRLALRARRADLVRLLVEYGLPVGEIDLREVLDTWDAELVEYLIDRGANAETNDPLAHALCGKVQSALRVLKRYRGQLAGFQEQANVALRHHCREGNLKWVSLLLWAGADPLTPGRIGPDEPHGEHGLRMTAVGVAALFGRFEVLDLKGVRLDVDHPATAEVVRWACEGRGLSVLTRLLDRGFRLNDQPDGGSSFVRHLLAGFRTDATWHTASVFDRDGADPPRARDRLTALRLLAERGGRWVPTDAREVGDLRRGLLKLRAEYTAEVVLVLSRHRACDRRHVDDLLRPASIKAHVARLGARIAKLLNGWQ